MESITVTPKALKKNLLLCAQKKLSVMIWGPPGIGKSSIVQQLADGMKLPMIDFRANLREPVDLLGVPSIVNGCTTWNPPDFLPIESRDGEYGIFLIDELPNAHRATQTALYQLILDFKLGNYELPKKWVIFAAGNRMEDHGGTFAMPAPLKSRMLHFELAPDFDEWVTWAIREKIHPTIIAFLRTEKDSFCPEPKVDQTATANPRTWHMLSKLMEPKSGANAGKLESGKTPSIETATIAAAVGLEQAQKFNNYLKILSKLPPIEKLYENPMKYPVPSKKQLSTTYAIVSLLAMHTVVKNVEAAIKYARRLDIEFQATLSNDLLNRAYLDQKNGVAELIHKTASYNEWVVELNKDLMEDK